jgi:hypothetical protein
VTAAAFAVVAISALAVIAARSPRIALAALAACTAVACTPFFLYASPHARLERAGELLRWIVAGEAAAVVALVALVRLWRAERPVLGPAAFAIGALGASLALSFVIDRRVARADALELAPWMPEAAGDISFDEHLLRFTVEDRGALEQKLPCTPHGPPYRRSCDPDACSTITLLREGGITHVAVATRDCR